MASGRGGGGSTLYHDGKRTVFWLVILAWLLGVTTVLAVVKFFVMTGVAILATIVGLLPGAAGDFAQYRSTAAGDQPPAASAPVEAGTAVSTGR